MASNLGTVFVELSLDDKVYKQKLSDIQPHAVATAKGVETAWKALGTKSAEVFDAQRRAAENAYTLIKNSALSATNDIIRAEQAKAAKIKTINEQQYGHQTGIIEKLKANWIAAAAAIGAAMVIASKAYSMAKLGAELEETRGILNNMARQYKLTADDIVASMARASKGLIANSDLMQVALGGLSKGLNPEQLINLSKAADTLGDSIGVTATQALTDLTQALESGRVKGLKNFAGSTIDLTDAFGELASKMSAAEKTQAMYALIMIHTTELQKKQTEAVDDAADKFESMEAKYKNYADTFSVVVMKMTIRLGDYLMAIGKAAQKTAQFFGLTDLPSGATRDFSNPKDDLAEYKRQLAELKALLAKKNGGEKALAAAKNLREEWEKIKQSLETDIRLEGLTGARLEFEQTLITYEKLEKQVEALPPDLQKSAKAFIDLWKAEKDAATTAESIGGYGRDAIKEMEEERQAVERLTEAYQGLMNSLDPFTANEDKYQKSISMLNDALGKGVITEPQHKSATESVKDEKTLMDANVYADFYAEIQGYEDEYRRKKFEAIEAEQKLRAKYYKDDVAAAKWAADEKEKFSRDELDAIGEKFDYNTRYINETIANTGNMIDAAMTMYDKESSEYKRLSEAKKAVQIAELAMTMTKNAQIIASNLGLVASNTGVAISNAGAAVTGASIGVGPTGFATAAAMIALMASVFAMYGIAAGGGSSASAPAPKTYNQGGDSGPLGAETGTASESMANSLEKVEGALDNIFNVEDVKLTKIYNELKQLNNNIMGLVSSIFRMGGVGGAMGQPLGQINNKDSNKMNWSPDTTPSLLKGFVDASNKFWTFGGNKVLEIFNGIANPLAGGISLLPKLWNSMFGGDIEVSLQKGGIEFGNILVKNVMDGMNVSAKQFALYKIEEDGGWFHSDSTSWETKYAALDSTVVNLLTKMFDNIGTTLVTVSEGLGTSIQAAENYIFKSAQLDLRNMNAEEMSKAISTYFSDVADKAASDLFGTIIKQYQQVNEALFETAIRLITDKTTVMNVLSATGHGIEEISTSVTKTREVISNEWTKWESDRVKWASSFFGRITTAFGGSYKVPEPDKYVTQTYQEITSNAQAIIELSESLIELAGGLDKLIESAETYYNAFYSESEKMGLLQGQLTGSFAEMEMALPKTRGAFRDVVEALDLTTQSGRETYVSLLNMAEGADQYYAAVEELADKRSEMEIELLRLQGDAAGALAKERASELEEMDASLRTFQSLIYAQEDFNDLLDKSTSLLEQWHSMESQLLELQGDKVGALAAKRADELDALDESLRPLQELLYAQEDLNNARAREITAVGNLITAQEGVVSELQGYVDKLKSARESMKMEGMAFAAQQATSARLAFAAVLAQARLGDLSGIGTIDNAMSKLVENANSPNSFRTKQEYEANYYKTYNDIAELEKLAGTQLSTEEQTLNTLKDQLKVLNQIAGNTDNSGLSVQDAQDAVNLAHAEVIAKQAALEQAKAQYEATRQAFVTMEEVVNSINGNNSQLTMSISEMTVALLEAKQAVVDATAGWATYQATQAAANAAAEQARIEALSAKQAAEAQAAADALLAKQIADAKAASDALAAQQAAQQAAAAEAERRATDPLYNLRMIFHDFFAPFATALSTNYSDVPEFAGGGNFSGGYRIVGENGPEIEFTGPSQITSNSQSKALLDNTEVVRELKSLREDIKAYGYAIAKNTGKSSKVLDRFDIDGLPDTRTLT